jgi:epsilon-lactone hydrolase
MKSFILFCSSVLLLVSCNSRNKTTDTPYYIPTTISPEARSALRSFPYKAVEKDLPGPDDIEGWQKYWDANEKRWTGFNDSMVLKFEPTLIDTVLGGVSAIEVLPRKWKNNGKVLIYLHGGAYTFFSSRTMLIGAVPIADITGIKVVSVNYTNPPKARYNQILDQVISVIKALLQQGYSLKDIGIYGDSAGGGLAASAVLKMRDTGIGMPAVVVLVSPWTDITDNGDTYHTLKGKDPIIEYGNSLDESSLAYAPAPEHKNPYVSPVYGDYSSGFPPTLIQGGTKEIFLSNFVRQYQVMDQAGITVKLDLYEGMWHVFQEINYDLPESKIAHQKFRDWVYLYLGIGNQ